MDKAVAANIPAITTGGIYPGVSNGAIITLIIGRVIYTFKDLLVQL